MNSGFDVINIETESASLSNKSSKFCEKNIYVPNYVSAMWVAAVFDVLEFDFMTLSQAFSKANGSMEG